MLYLISYDIEDDKKRTRLAHKLKDFGRRVQYSVFEADINEEEIIKLQTLLGKVQLGKNDSLRLYRLCGECRKQIKIWGKGEVTKDREYYIA